MFCENKSTVSTAFHESGHAVSSLLLNVPFDSVNIEKKYFSNGEVRISEQFANSIWFIKTPERCLTTPFQKNRLENFLTVLYAGFCAEKKFTGTENSRGSQYDFDLATQLISILSESPKQQRLYRKLFLTKAEELFTRPDGSTNKNICAAAAKVALKLLSRKELSSDEVKATCGNYLSDENHFPFCKRKAA
ncbi:MAG: hypothetical protein HY063_08350 [Bacteroidetes bacterium]|nr:hypothetical protein [Bacteroidota bacterium]